MLSSLSSRPILRVDTLCLKFSHTSLLSAISIPRLWPLLDASTRFSAMVIFGAVPLNGFWNTLPIRFALLCSGQPVMSFPESSRLPESVIIFPATAFRSVDLPDPFVPITTTHEPSSIQRSTPCSALTSFKVPGLNVIFILFILSICDCGIFFI